MAILTQEQINQLKQKGLSDSAILSLAKSSGYTMPSSTTVSTQSNTLKELTPSQIYTLKNKGLSDTAISSLSNEYGYTLPTPKEPTSFLKSIVTEPIKALLVKPAVRFGQALAVGATELLGNEQQKQAVREQVQKDVQTPFLGINVEGQKKFGQGGATQLVGETANVASYLYGGQGATKVASNLIKGEVGTGIATGTITGAVGGGLYSGGQAIQDPNATVGSVIGQTAIGSTVGGVTGGVLSGANTLINPVYKTIKTGANKVNLIFASPEDKASYIIQKRTNELQNIVNNNQSLRKIVNSADRQGYNPIKDLADSDLLVGAVNKDGRIDGQLVQDRFNQTIDGTENVIKNNFEQTGEKVNISRVRKYMDDVLNSDYIPSKAYKQAQNKFDDVIYGLEKKGKIDANGDILFSDIQQEKIDAYKLSNYLDPEKTLADKALGKAFKAVIDNDSRSIPNLQEINKELGRYLSVKSLIDKLDQKVVKGGRLGKYFAQAVGAIAGNSIGGPIGAIAGAEAGSAVQGQILKRTFGKTTGRNIIPKSQILEEAIQKGKGYSNQVDALHTPQTNIAKNNKNAISK